MVSFVMGLISAGTQTIWTLPPNDELGICPTPLFTDTDMCALDFRGKPQTAFIQRFEKDRLRNIGPGVCGTSSRFTSNLGSVYLEEKSGCLSQSKLATFPSIGDHLQEKSAVGLTNDVLWLPPCGSRENILKIGSDCVYSDQSNPKTSSCHREDHFLSSLDGIASVGCRDERVSSNPSEPGMSDRSVGKNHHFHSKIEANQPEKKTRPEYPNCQVCGEESAGFNCGAFVCEACKKFFIRSAKNSEKSYLCLKSGEQRQCEINKVSRTKCPACRYKKCVEVGMLPPGHNLIEVTKVDSLDCKVCGRPASGFHFGVLSCECCRVFFRRCLQSDKTTELVCLKGRACDIRKELRSACRACRYKKCVTTGMSPDATRVGRLPNSIRHARLKESKDLSPPLMSAEKEESSIDHGDHLQDEELTTPNPDHLQTCRIPLDSKNTVKSEEAEAQKISSTDIMDAADIPESEENGMSPSTYFADMAYLSSHEYEPSSNDLMLLKNAYIAFQEETNKYVELTEQRVSVITKAEMMEVAFSNFRYMMYSQVDFLKKLPGFMAMNIEDKVTISRHSLYKNLLLLVANSYDLNTNQYLYYLLRSDSIACDWLDEVLPEVALKSHFSKIGRLIKSLDLDIEESALVASLNCFDCGIGSEITDQNGFLSMYRKYMSLLASYIKGKNGNPMRRFTELVSILNACAEARREHAEGARQLVLNHIELQLQAKGDIAYMLRMFQEVYTS